MKTQLYEEHKKLKAKIIPFCGWDMPLQYTSVIKEHLAVRKGAGIFDVSHMGRIFITGDEAELFLDFLSTNTIKGKKVGSATYTVFCDDKGFCVDDLIVFKVDEKTFFIVVNACNREKDLAHIQKYAQRYRVTVTPYYDKEGILAVQGPLSKQIISDVVVGFDLQKPMQVGVYRWKSQEITISTTGYTGEKGVEVFISNDQIVSFWQTLLSTGEKYGLMPVGLGARDTLRLEMGFALYGHELSNFIYPVETVSAWTVKWSHDFLGKKAIEENHPIRKQYGVILEGKGIPRQNYSVFLKGENIGIVTSGNFSPSLNRSIAIIMVDKLLKIGDMVDIEIRKKYIKAKVVNLPFLQEMKR